MKRLQDVDDAENPEQDCQGREDAATPGFCHRTGSSAYSISTLAAPVIARPRDAARLRAEPHYEAHFDTAEFSQWNSHGDFESLIHVCGFDQDEAAQMLFGLGERSVGSHCLALADAGSTRLLHRLGG